MYGNPGAVREVVRKCCCQTVERGELAADKTAGFLFKTGLRVTCKLKILMSIKEVIFSREKRTVSD